MAATAVFQWIAGNRLASYNRVSLAACFGPRPKRFQMTATTRSLVSPPKIGAIPLTVSLCVSTSDSNEGAILLSEKDWPSARCLAALQVRNTS